MTSIVSHIRNSVSTAHRPVFECFKATMNGCRSSDSEILIVCEGVAKTAANMHQINAVTAHDVIVEIITYVNFAFRNEAVDDYWLVRICPTPIIWYSFLGCLTTNGCWFCSNIETSL